MRSVDSENQVGRFFLVKLAVAIAIPVALLALIAWWSLAAGIEDRVLATQADAHTAAVQTVVGPRIVDDAADGVVVFGPAGLQADVDELLAPMIGVTDLRLIATDGTVLFSSDADEMGKRFALSGLDESALKGIGAGRVSTPAVAETGDTDAGTSVDGPTSDGPTLSYVLPVRQSPDGPVVAAAQITVVGDPWATLAADARSELRTSVLVLAAISMLVVFGTAGLLMLRLRKEANASRALAMSDNLTGLANRMKFHERLDEAIAAASRDERERVGLLMLDLDGFKAINDTGGHAAGDRLLKRVAAKLEDATRKHEIACRLGGDEFAILVPRLAGREELVALADRLHNELTLEVDFIDGRSLRISASIGLAIYPEEAVNSDELVAVADVGMYTVKASRRAQLRASGVPVGRRP